MRKANTSTPPPAARQQEPQTLTEFQERVCHLAADMIMNGGQKSDVANLLRGTIGHSLHLRYSKPDHADEINNSLPGWLRRLSRHWPKKIELQHVLPTTVSERARANICGHLRNHFEIFRGYARVHELYLLDNILMDFASCTAEPDTEFAESPFAEAFMLALDRDDTYVKVPRDRIEAVEEFLKTLDETPDGEAEKTIGRPKLMVFPERQRERCPPVA